MRWITRLAGGALAAAMVLLLAPLPASAGGPTSVLLVSPSRHTANALYYRDDAYERLARLLGESPTADPSAPEMNMGQSSEAITVTWLAHDVNVWRVDRILLNAGGQTWVDTKMLTHDSPIDIETPGVRHRPADPKALIDLLSGLRMLTGTIPPGYGAKPPAADQTADRTAVQTVASADQPASLDLFWLLIGGAAGAMIVVGFRPLVRRLRRT